MARVQLILVWGRCVFVLMCTYKRSERGRERTSRLHVPNGSSVHLSLYSAACMSDFTWTGIRIFNMMAQDDKVELAHKGADKLRVCAFVSITRPHAFHTCQHTKATREAIESRGSCGICYSNGVWLFVCGVDTSLCYYVQLLLLSLWLVGINGIDVSRWGAYRESLTSLRLLYRIATSESLIRFIGTGHRALQGLMGMFKIITANK